MIRRKHDGWGHLMELPCYLIYFIFIFIPVIMTLWLSFRNYDLFTRNDFIGLANHIRLFGDVRFLKSLRNTSIYSLGTIVPQIVMGLLLAVALNKGVPGKKAFRLAFYLPYVVSMVSISMLWLWIYEPASGVLNQTMRFLHLPPRRWLYNQDLALSSLILMGVWKMTGYNMIIYLAGLQQIPPHLYEAAEIDGASAISKFFRITVPLVQPTTFFLFVINTIQSFSVFEQVNIMTDGGPNNATTTIVHQLYTRAFEEFQMGYACSMGVFLLCITLILTVLNFKYGRQGYDLM